jgi:hypothetical protein
MMHQFPPSSSVSVAINSAAFAIRETAAAAEDDPVEKKEHSESSVRKEEQLFTKYSDTQMKPDVGILSKDFLKNKGREQTTIANSAPSIVQAQSTVKGAPDIGILSKDFMKDKGQETVGKQFAIHRKERASAADVDVGILDKQRQGVGQWRQQKKVFDTNLHVMNKVLGRSLQSEEYLPYLPLMCPGKYGGPGTRYFANLFNQTDDLFFTEEGYFPKCSCPSPTTCGPVLCECLELDADGDILQCMDPFKQLCEGTMNIDGIPGPWSMEDCLGDKQYAITYCSFLPCFLDGDSFWQCHCNLFDRACTDYRDEVSCAMSKCCQAQTDDEGRKTCIYEGVEKVEEYIPFIMEEITSRFNECSFGSENDKSIVQCYCESFSYGLCANFGMTYPDVCEAMNCCWEQTEDDSRLDCFSRFRDGLTGWDFYHNLDTIQESCVASGRSSDQCKCDIQGLSNCVGVEYYSKEPSCDLFQCCQSQTDDNDDGRKDCLVQDEAQLMYAECINNGNTTESCVCGKSNMLCTSGHSDARHCELSSCCREQSDDAGRKECIGNFTTSQPSSAPSETTGASPTAASALPGTSSASTHTPFCSKSLSKATTKTLAAAIIGWVLLTWL